MENQENKLSIPAAIIFAGIIIAVGIIISNTKGSSPATSVDTVKSASISLQPISSADHILGDPNAPIVIVEYSDPSCPFCKLFQTSLENIMGVYGTAGKVAWVYRHFPLDKPDANGNVLHPNAGHEAQGFECAATLGDKNAFWLYEKEWFNTFPLQGATDRSTASDTVQLTQIAKDIGIDPVKFNTCLSSGATAQTVQAHYQSGVVAGAQGTPYSIMALKNALSADKIDALENLLAQNAQFAPYVLVSNDKKMISLNGNLPLAFLNAVIAIILK